MASASSSSSSSSSSVTVIRQLAELLRSNGHRIMHGDSKVCLTSDSLTILNKYFQGADIARQANDFDDSARLDSIPTAATNTPTFLRIDRKLKEDLIFLYHFLQKIVTVKIIHTSLTLQGDVRLHPFRNINYLEVKRISPRMIRGLAELRDRLETLICTQSLSKIEDLIGDCGGDAAQMRPWRRLKILFLDHNSIESVDQSLKCLPVLESLDLSHNRLKDCSRLLDIIPHVKHLNLSSNHLHIIPLWSPVNDPCRLITLKIRQNALQEIRGIQLMKSIEELDISDNFIISMPEEIREMSNLKRLFLARNPFAYADNARRTVISNLPPIYASGDRDLTIDNRPLTAKEREMIVKNRHRPSSNSSSGFPTYSSPPTTTTSEASTDPESIPNRSSESIVSRRKSRGKRRDGRLRPLDRDDTPNENATSGSEAETAQRRQLGRVLESTQEMDNGFAAQGRTSSALNDPDDFHASKSIASSIPRKLANDITQHSKRKVSPRNRRFDQTAKILIEVVDDNNVLSDTTPIPDSPESHRDLSFKGEPTPVPTLEPMRNSIQDDHLAGDSIRTIFFVTDQTNDTGDAPHFLILELDAMFFIEKENDAANSIQKHKYSTIKLQPNDESRPRTVQLTLERQKNRIERRVYLFDTVQDQQKFLEEVERHLQPATPVQLEPISPSFLECSKCGKNFPQLSSMRNSTGNPSPVPICMNCQSITSLPPAILTSALESKGMIDVSTDESVLDHRLHLHVGTEHFTHDNENIKFHFRCLVVRSTSTEHFLAQTIFTNFGIYIFHHRSTQFQENIEEEYILVGKDLLTNVLMLDIGYRRQSFTIELQSAAFAFLLADEMKTQKIIEKCLDLLLPIVEKGEGALQKISRISSDEYRQRLFQIIRDECDIDEPTDEMIDYYSIMIRMDQAGNSQVIALLLLQNWILMIEDAYEVIGQSRHVRLPAYQRANQPVNLPLKCDLMHLELVTNYQNSSNLFVFDFVDESETKKYRWRLESLTTQSKVKFLDQVRQTYQSRMHISMPETVAML